MMVWEVFSTLRAMQATVNQTQYQWRKTLLRRLVHLEVKRG